MYTILKNSFKKISFNAINKVGAITTSTSTACLLQPYSRYFSIQKKSLSSINRDIFRFLRPKIESITLNKRSYSNKLVLFDIDGVILRGHTAIKNANLALNNLEKNNVPYMFLTNGSPCTEQNRAKELSEILDVEIDPESMFMAQTPFRELTDEHDKNYLCINQGAVKDIIQNSGFKNVCTIFDLLERFPTYDACNKIKRISESSKNPDKFSKIDGIILMEDPIHWESVYQLLLDVIITEGYMECGDANDYLNKMVNHTIMPIYVGCTDYFWVTEAPYPRIAHGTFLKGLESLYKKTTNRTLEYAKVYGKPNIDTYKYIERIILTKFRNQLPEHLFFIGYYFNRYIFILVRDNPLTDIYGANVYKQYIADKNSSAFKVYSILVRSGVFTGTKIDPHNSACSLNFLHHSTPKNSMFLYPHAIVEDAHEAVNHILEADY